MKTKVFVMITEIFWRTFWRVFWRVFWRHYLTLYKNLVIVRFFNQNLPNFCSFHSDECLTDTLISVKVNSFWVFYFCFLIGPTLFGLGIFWEQPCETIFPVGPHCCTCHTFSCRISKNGCSVTLQDKHFGNSIMFRFVIISIIDGFDIKLTTHIRFYDHFWPFFWHMYGSLSQNWG